MYVCNCNGLNEKDIDAARRAGVTSWPDVYAFHGCAPKCGKCVTDVSSRLNSETEEAATPFLPENSFGEA